MGPARGWQENQVHAEEWTPKVGALKDVKKKSTWRCRQKLGETHC